MDASIKSTLLARVAAAQIERARAEAALSKRFAPRFNAVALLAPGETKLSEVFRWLLEETESHGQGAVFRDLFVTDLLGEAPEAWAGARVACEVSTADGRGRMDLVMESRDGSRCLIIENKPWAAWQADQLSRYWNDQVGRRASVSIRVLSGAEDPSEALDRHWATGNAEPLPSSICASGFDAVAAWLEACAVLAHADRVRSFLLDLAEYCRRFILSEPSMAEIDETSDLILAGGEDTLKAAFAIAAAVPLALTREIARRVNGALEVVGGNYSVRMSVDGVILHFVLFGNINPWAGVTDKARVQQLQGDFRWGPAEAKWPRWIYLKHMNDQGRALAKAAAGGDVAAVAELVPAVARDLIGLPGNSAGAI